MPTKQPKPNPQAPARRRAGGSEDNTAFLTNVYNPEKQDANVKLSLRPNLTPEKAWAAHLQWLKDKHIGLPKETESRTVSDLIEMGMVGVYVDETQ